MVIATRTGKFTQNYWFFFSESNRKPINGQSLYSLHQYFSFVHQVQLHEAHDQKRRQYRIYKLSIEIYVQKLYDYWHATVKTHSNLWLLRELSTSIINERREKKAQHIKYLTLKTIQCEKKKNICARTTAEVCAQIITRNKIRRNQCESLVSWSLPRTFQPASNSMWIGVAVGGIALNGFANTFHTFEMIVFAVVCCQQFKQHCDRMQIVIEFVLATRFYHSMKRTRRKHFQSRNATRERETEKISNPTNNEFLLKCLTLNLCCILINCWKCIFFNTTATVIDFMCLFCCAWQFP